MLRSLGARVVEVAVPDIERINHLSNVVLSAEAAAIHEAWIAGRPDDYQEQVRNRYEPGLHVPAVKYIQALAARAGLLREFVDTALSGADALHTPAIPFPIPTREETNVGGGERMAEMVARAELVHPRRQLSGRAGPGGALRLHRERPAHGLPAHGPPVLPRRRSSASATPTSPPPTGTTRMPDL